MSFLVVLLVALLVALFVDLLVVLLVVLLVPFLVVPFNLLFRVFCRKGVILYNFIYSFNIN